MLDRLKMKTSLVRTVCNCINVRRCFLLIFVSLRKVVFNRSMRIEERALPVAPVAVCLPSRLRFGQALMASSLKPHRAGESG